MNTIMRSHWSFVLCPLLMAVCPTLEIAAAEQAVAATGSAYVNDFEKAEQVPEEMMVLAGDFSVRKEGGNQVLELAGTPLDTFGILVGPEATGEAACGARILGTRTGRRFPEFGVGLGGPSGYRLWLMPAVGELQLLKGDRVKVRIPYAWTSGTWTVFRLHMRPLADGKWRVEGKAWAQGQREPAEWMIQMEEPGKPATGRGSIWGIPYSEKPIQFDDLTASGSK
ncbi:MAG TPA: hypothetical protein VHP11_11740 [Tepidisphaeraceae bacterium]|nr:hypothetical protein [Tepidisphaeraceae bacterium]